MTESTVSCEEWLINVKYIFSKVIFKICQIRTCRDVKGKKKTGKG